MRKLLFVLAAASAAAGCKTTTEIPKVDDIPRWAQRESGRCLEIPEFDVSRENLCAVGRAENITSQSLGLETAGTRARANIAKVIETKMRAFNEAVQDSLSKAGKTDEIQKVSSGVETVLKVTLSGVSVPVNWHDKSNGTYYALAMVDNTILAKALKDLQASAELSEATKAEINKRYDDVVNRWDEAEEKAGIR